MKPGRAGTMTHDYKRNGTTTLFAALDVLDRHRDRSVPTAPPPRSSSSSSSRRSTARSPSGLDVHLILDNYGTHNHPNVKAWLDAPPALPPALHPDLQSTG